MITDELVLSENLFKLVQLLFLYELIVVVFSNWLIF